MSFTYCDLAFAVFTVVLVFIGYSRGFLVSVLGLLKYLFGIPAGYFVSNRFSDAVYTGFVRETLRSTIAERIEKSADIDGFVAGLKQSVSTMPEAFTSKMDVSALDNASNEALVDFIETKIAAPIASSIIHTLLFVITFFIISSVIATLIAIFRHSDKKDKKKEEEERSTIKKGNRLLGGVFGLVKALVLILVISAIASYGLKLLPSDVDNAFISSIRDSYVINHFNQINPMV